MVLFRLYIRFVLIFCLCLALAEYKLLRTTQVTQK